MRVGSFDYLVGAGEQRRWHGEAERLSSLEIDDQLELGRLLDRKIGRISTFQNLTDKGLPRDGADGSRRIAAGVYRDLH